MLDRVRFGVTPSFAGARALGSILAPEDADAGLNFITQSAKSLFTWRRRQGWGVDPIRCSSYMTSSQALTLNLFGPLCAHPMWAARVLSALLSIDVYRVAEFSLEYAPTRPSEYLGDSTRIDGWLTLQTSNGPLALVVEIKYADRFNSRHILLHERIAYRALAERTQLWNLDDNRTQARSVNQLLRCHALGAAVWSRRFPELSPPQIMVVTFPGDRLGERAVESYRQILLSPFLVTAVNLDQVLKVMSETTGSEEERRVVSAFQMRYLEHHLSEDLWREHLAVRRSKARGARFVSR
nr:hypothetical protein [Asanoa iriomotensis]